MSVLDKLTQMSTKIGTCSSLIKLIKVKKQMLVQHRLAGAVNPVNATTINKYPPAGRRSRQSVDIVSQAGRAVNLSDITAGEAEPSIRRCNSIVGSGRDRKVEARGGDAVKI